MSKGYHTVFLIFCLGVAFAVWMLGYGLGLQLFYKDSRILETTITTNPFVPIQQFWHFTGNPALQKVAIGSLVPALAAGGLVAYAGLRPQGSPLGDAAFQDIASLRRGK